MNDKHKLLAGVCLQCAASHKYLAAWKELANEFGGHFVVGERLPTLSINREALKQVGFRCLIAEIELLLFTTGFGAEQLVLGIQQAAPESRLRDALRDIPLASSSQLATDWLSAYGLGETLSPVASADWRGVLDELTRRFSLDQCTVAIEAVAERTALQAGLEARGAQVIMLDLFPLAAPYPLKAVVAGLPDEHRERRAISISDAEELMRWQQYLLERGGVQSVTFVGVDPQASELAAHLDLSWIDWDLSCWNDSTTRQRETLAWDIKDR